MRTLVLFFALCALVHCEDLRRFLYGCYPCPPPPCADTVIGPRNCCGYCPDPETSTPSVTSSPEVETKELHVKHDPLRHFNSMVRRFIHGCPFAFPCPPPPCFNAIFGPKNCCGYCPDPEPKTTTPIMTSSPELSELERRDLPFTVTTIPTTTECPYSCQHHGYHYCHPLPCHIACVDAVKDPGDCCYECRNGPNCSYKGQIIPEGQNVTLTSGETVFCSTGDIYGGSVNVFTTVG